MKTTYYALHSLENFKKMVFYKLNSMGFDKASSESVEDNITHKAFIVKFIQNEIQMVESRLEEYKTYLNDLTSDSKK